MAYYVIYDGNCNLCVTLVNILESLDRGDRFQYTPMQDQATLDYFGITAADCERGMVLINGDYPAERWQGSDAVEEIGRLLPAGDLFVQAYRAIPGMKWTGDRVYEQVRDNRYTLFGERKETYWSEHPVCIDGCGPFGEKRGGA